MAILHLHPIESQVRNNRSLFGAGHDLARLLCHMAGGSKHCSIHGKGAFWHKIAKEREIEPRDKMSIVRRYCNRLEPHMTVSYIIIVLSAM